MKKFLTQKKKGYAVTLEVLVSIVFWCIMLTATVWIINAQRNQKFMYDTYISVATQCSKWGGTDTNMMAVNGKNTDIVVNAQNAIQQAAPYLNAQITASPDKITSANNQITVTMTWTDYGFKTGFLDGFPGLNSTHTITGTFNSVAEPGSLL